MNIANEEWGFQRKRFWKMWCRKLKISWMYNMFNNIFYTWDFVWNGEIKKWRHQAMVT